MYHLKWAIFRPCRNIILLCQHNVSFMSAQAHTPFDIDSFLKTLTTGPGVYQMYGSDNQLRYVGKARNLKNRVTSYFRKGAHDAKTIRMLSDVERIEVTRTASEKEALLLENNLIKQHKPPFNVMLRDDKSFPYILVTKQEFPRITFHRGAQKIPGRYFGPYPNAGAARDTIGYLQKLFRLRNCSDSYFENRSRPCLQFQIRRCTAPCVDAIKPDEYQGDTRAALAWLEGRDQTVTRELGQQMETAAEALDFERAAWLRDQLKALRKIAGDQNIESRIREADVLGLSRVDNAACISVGFIRHGRHLGHRSYFPRLPKDTNDAELLAAFIAQHYDSRPAPREIIVDSAAADEDLLAEALSDRAEYQVQIKSKVRGQRAEWRKMARMTADQALTGRLQSDASVRQQMEALRDALDLDETPTRLECFDISHSSGEKAVASCVVFGEEGARKSDYRRYNISGITPGDDYAAIHQAVSRRYRDHEKEAEASSPADRPLPDLLFIDGGKGQLAQAVTALDALNLLDRIKLVSVAKGPDRRAGQEQLFIPNASTPMILPQDSPALRIIQQIRDESHRFAITGHRQRRDKSRRESRLEQLPGVGPKRRQALLRHFGGLREVSGASVNELAKVEGVSQQMAQRIYDQLH